MNSMIPFFTVINLYPHHRFKPVVPLAAAIRAIILSGSLLNTMESLVAPSCSCGVVTAQKAFHITSWDQQFTQAWRSDVAYAQTWSLLSANSWISTFTVLDDLRSPKLWCRLLTEAWTSEIPLNPSSYVYVTYSHGKEHNGDPVSNPLPYVLAVAVERQHLFLHASTQEVQWALSLPDSYGFRGLDIVAYNSSSMTRAAPSHSQLSTSKKFQRTMSCNRGYWHTANT